ncbi:protein O-mannose kinase-like [Clavelina lepadiformis]|uniref:protein O-mannose kinase-like n=1 Tax=Clavelina lepadiformis TaxID=159417 RepID=UPI0040419468
MTWLTNCKKLFIRLVILIVSVCLIAQTLAFLDEKKQISVKNKTRKIQPLLERTETNNEQQVKAEHRQTITRENDKKCEHGYFKVDEMVECEKWLGCNEINKLLKKENKKLGEGWFKQVHLVQWKGHKFAMVMPKSLSRKGSIYRSRIAAETLASFQPHREIIQLTGLCKEGNNTIFLTESCNKYGTPTDLLNSPNYVKLSAKKRMRLIIDIIKIYVFLHHEIDEPRVNCDTHEAKQALGQFLVTDDMRVVLSDVDELPIDNPAKNKIATCRNEPKCRLSDAKFMPPEEQYNEEECPEDLSQRQHEVTIKADVWKIPAISNEILNETLPDDSHRNQVIKINKLLSETHARCKSINPQKRISSIEILKQYLTIYKKINGR